MNKKFENLGEMKEYRLAMQVKDALNDYGFDYAAFAASIPLMHPTLQQNLYKLLKECLVVADRLHVLTNCVVHYMRWDINRLLLFL